MKVILTEDLHGTGKRGEVVDVRDGHGRNFLIPRGLALPATEGNVKRFENVVRNLATKRGRDLKHSEDVKARLEGASLSVKKKVGLDGRLFGSVTPKDIVEAIKKAVALDIDKKGVRMVDPIKMTGAYTVDVHLKEGVTATVRVEVEAEA
jgi:large subunit ribosomal protein L9